MCIHANRRKRIRPGVWMRDQAPMTETIVRPTIHPISVMLVLPGSELWGAEGLRADLAATGLRLMAEEDFKGEASVIRKPAATLAFLSGQMQRDTAVCRKLVGQGLAPVIAVSANREETYVLALFASGVEDVIARPIKSRELAARIRSILRRTQPALFAQTGRPVVQGRTLLPAVPAVPENRPKSRFQSFLCDLQKCFLSRNRTG